MKHFLMNNEPFEALSTTPTGRDLLEIGGADLSQCVRLYLLEKGNKRVELNIDDTIDLSAPGRERFEYETDPRKFELDGEQYESSSPELTPNQILSLSGQSKPEQYYLIELTGSGQKPLKDHPDKPIQITCELRRFISAFCGPTPVAFQTGKESFRSQLVELGYEVHDIPRRDAVYIEYLVEVGPNAGRRVYLGFGGLQDFPANVPHGPSFKPLDEGWIPTRGNIRKNLLGPGWDEWSRPFSEWGKTDRSVKAYLSHVVNVLMNQ